MSFKRWPQFFSNPYFCCLKLQGPKTVHCLIWVQITNVICEFFAVVISAVLLYIPTRCLVHLQYINCKTNNVLEQLWLLNLLKQVFLLYISLRLCNNGPSDTQREATEHWGDIKSDFVPLGVPLVAREFWWAVWCSARQHNPERAEWEEWMSFYFITNSTVRNTPACLQCLLHYSYSECWTALPSFCLLSLSLSTNQSVFLCSARINMLNTEFYWIDRIKCSYSVRKCDFTINTLNTHISVRWCACVSVSTVHTERQSGTETVFTWSEWTKCDQDQSSSRVSDSKLN